MSDKWWLGIRLYFVTFLLFFVLLYLIPQISYSQQQTSTSNEQPNGEVTTSIIAALSAIGGAITGGLVTYFATMKIEDRKDERERKNFQEFKEGLIRSIAAELSDYQKFLRENLIHEIKYRHDYMYIDWGRKEHGTIKLPYEEVFIDHAKISALRSAVKEKRDPEYRILTNTALEQLIKSFEPELLVLVLSAYKIFHQITDMVSYQISVFEDRGKSDLLYYTKQAAIPTESIRHFYDTVEDISDKISSIIKTDEYIGIKRRFEEYREELNKLSKNLEDIKHLERIGQKVFVTQESDAIHNYIHRYMKLILDTSELLSPLEGSLLALEIRQELWDLLNDLDEDIGRLSFRGHLANDADERAAKIEKYIDVLYELSRYGKTDNYLMMLDELRHSR